MNKMVLVMCLLLTGMAVNTQADTTYFIDGILGQADQKNTIGGFDAISGSDSSKGIRAGFYLNRIIGVEINYVDYGVSEDSLVDSFGDTITNTLDTRMTGVGLQGVLPLGHKVRLIGRAGIAAWDLRFSERDSAFPRDVFVDDTEGADAYFGLGLRFDIEDNVRIAVEYENMDFDAALGSADTDQTIHNVAISLGVTF